MNQEPPPESAVCCQRLHRHTLPMGVLGLCACEDEQKLYAACMDGVYEVSADSGDFAKFYEHDSYVSGIAYIYENHTLVSSGYDGALRWFDLSTRQVVRYVQAHSFWSWDLGRGKDCPVVASVGGQYLAGSYEYHPLASDEPTVRVYNALTGHLLDSYHHLPPVQSVAVSDDGARVGYGNLMGDVGVSGDRSLTWNTPDFTGFGIIKSHCQIGGIYATAFAGRDRLLVAGMGPMRDPMAGNGKQRWQCFDMSGSTPRKVAEAKDDQVGEGLMETLAMHPDGRHFAMGGRLRGGSWNVGLFDLSTGDLVHSIKTETRVTKVLFSADGTRLYIAGADKQSKDAAERFGVLDIHEIAIT